MSRRLGLLVWALLTVTACFLPIGLLALGQWKPLSMSEAAQYCTVSVKMPVTSRVIAADIVPVLSFGLSLV